MPVSVLTALPISREEDVFGNILGGGLLYTFQAGSSTPLPSYQDIGCSVPNTNPVVLDATGRAIVRYLPQAYKLKLTMPDSAPGAGDGTVLWTIDNFWPPVTAEPVSFSALISSFAISPSYSRTTAEISAGVIPSNLSYPAGSPERYLATFTYASDTTGVTGTDFSAAINTALSIFGGPDGQYQPVILGAHLYTIGSTLIVPAGQTLTGAGCNAGGLCCKSTFAGPVITDNGNAAHLVITGIAIYGNHATGITFGIQLGKTIAFGTNGTLDQIYITSIPSGSIAIDCTCNIVEMGALYTNNFTGSFDGSGCRFVGTGIHIRTLSIVGCSGFPDENGNNTCLLMDDGVIDFYECEAPGTNVFSASINGLASIKYAVISLSVGTTFIGQLIDISGNATTWDFNLGALYYGGISGTYPTFANLIYDRLNGTYQGAGNSSNTTNPKGMVGHYQSDLQLGLQPLALKKQPFNAFTLKVVNTGGTLQHSMTAVGSAGTPGSLLSSVPNASTALVNTPTGTDGSTAFASGGKISSASTSIFIIQSGVELAADFGAIASLGACTISGGTTPYTVQCYPLSFNVNGTTQQWTIVQLLNGFTGAPTAWSSALGTPGNSMTIHVIGFFK